MPCLTPIPLLSELWLVPVPVPVPVLVRVLVGLGLVVRVRVVVRTGLAVGVGVLLRLLVRGWLRLLLLSLPPPVLPPLPSNDSASSRWCVFQK